MKCPFCAETIQEEAILCRFCDAQKENGEWVRQRAPSPPPKGHLTMQIAGAFFILSAFFEVIGLTSPIARFGEMRGGALAVVYHSSFVGLYCALGYALLKRKEWGYRATLLGTLIVTLDRGLYLLDGAAREAEIVRATGGSPEVLEILDPELLHSMTTLTILGTLVGWWGFAAYVHYRRAYFAPAGAVTGAKGEARG